MRVIKSIALRDFKAIVLSPLFFLLMGLVSCLWSYNFARQLVAFSLQSAGQGLNIHFSLFVHHFSNLIFVLMVVIPLFTMRLIAEEKKQRSYDLILTAPITATEIVLGKFLGGFLAALVFMMIAFIYPLMTLGLADFHGGPLVSAFVGLVLMSGLFVSVGLFSSSLTNSIMISVIMGFMFNFIIWVVGQGAIGFSDHPFLIDLAQQFSASFHVSAFMYGKLSLGGIIFFLSTIMFFIFLTQRVIESSRWRS